MYMPKLFSLPALSLFFGLSAIGICSCVYAQSLQLPTFGYSGVATSVSVPDRGAVITGGVNTSSSYYTESGSPLSPIRNRAWGHSTTSGTFSTHVYVHDFEAMDAQLLGSPDAPGSGAVVRNGNRTIPVQITALDSEDVSAKARVAPSAFAIQKHKRSAPASTPQTFFLSGTSDLSGSTPLSSPLSSKGKGVKSTEPARSAKANRIENQTIIQASQFDE